MLRKIIISSLAIFTFIFVYANFRFVNPSAQLRKVDVRTLEIENYSDVSLQHYEEFVRSNDAIRAFNLNKESNIVGITYEYERINDAELIELISFNGQLNVQRKSFAEDNRPQCPMHGVLETWEKCMDALRIVQ